MLYISTSNVGVVSSEAFGIFRKLDLVKYKNCSRKISIFGCCSGFVKLVYCLFCPNWTQCSSYGCKVNTGYSGKYACYGNSCICSNPVPLSALRWKGGYHDIPKFLCFGQVGSHTI